MNVLKQPVDEMRERDLNKLLPKVFSVKRMLEKSVDDVEDEELKHATDALPRNVVKLPKEEADVYLGQNAKPLKHTVKKGETIKSISAKYGVSYGELSTHLLSTEGTTSIAEGMEITIPRHFLDLTRA